SLMLGHFELENRLKNEAFYSHILTLNIGGKEESAVLKDLQRHPAKSVVTHLDLQRVVADEELRMHVPLHFKGEDIAPGVKQGGGVVQHHQVDVEVLCLPKHLPEFIEVDVSAMELNDAIHLSHLKLPEGVTLVALQHDDDQAVVSVHIPRIIEEPVVEAAPSAEVPVVGDEAKAAAEAEKTGEKAGEKKDDRKDDKGGK
ncbi:MAG: 50S ribosomal protein L25/general stress protein Ctc, partial [Nevskiales bacterium]